VNREKKLNLLICKVKVNTKEYKTSTCLQQRISDKHLVGAVAVDAFLIVAEFGPAITEHFAHGSVVKVRVLTTHNAALLLAE